jgi:hypothetical protein
MISGVSCFVWCAQKGKAHTRPFLLFDLHCAFLLRRVFFVNVRIFIFNRGILLDISTYTSVLIARNNYIIA